MRKADYALLAQTIKTELEHASRNEKNNSLGTGYFEGYAYALHCVARDFADGASVNKPEFLKACGLE